MTENKESETNHCIENKVAETNDYVKNKDGKTNDYVENKDGETNNCDKDPLICAIDEITEKMTKLKIFDTNDITKDILVDYMTEENILLLERGPIIDLVECFFPSLNEESIYWSPEIYWDKLIEKTGIDLDEAMCLYGSIQEEKDENIKNDLKKKLINLFTPAIKKH